MPDLDLPAMRKMAEEALALAEECQPWTAPLHESADGQNWYIKDSGGRIVLWGPQNGMHPDFEDVRRLATSWTREPAIARALLAALEEVERMRGWRELAFMAARGHPNIQGASMLFHGSGCPAVRQGPKALECSCGAREWHERFTALSSRPPEGSP